MNVGLYDIDSKIPNLALMKLSRYWKEVGAEVERYLPLWDLSYDRIFASSVFSFSDKSEVNSRMEIGGTGFNKSINLPQEIENLQPDYTLYDYPHSIGFTMRGCRFRCKFCVVPKKEGRPKPFNTITEIWTNKGSNFIILLDNDFFGNIEWRERIAEIKKYNLRVNFSQGLNIRIITDEQAKSLTTIRFRNIKCDDNHPMLHFAWDKFDDEKVVDAGIQRVLDAGIKPYQMTFFVLIGFDTTHKQDLYRVKKLHDLGMHPFVMPYDKSNSYQKRFARWVNHKAIFNSVKWHDYI